MGMPYIMSQGHSRAAIPLDSDFPVPSSMSELPGHRLAVHSVRCSKAGKPEQLAWQSSVQLKQLVRRKPRLLPCCQAGLTSKARRTSPTCQPCQPTRRQPEASTAGRAPPGAAGWLTCRTGTGCWTAPAGPGGWCSGRGRGSPGSSPRRCRTPPAAGGCPPPRSGSGHS